MKVRATLAMSSTAVAGVGMFAVAWLATLRLSPAEQGYFFSFLSLGGLVQLSDFGMSYASLLAAAGLGSDGSSGRLSALAAFVARANLACATVMAAAIGGVGALVFANAGTTDASAVDWRGPWLAYLIALVLAQVGQPGLSLREGGGRAPEVWGLRLWCELLAAVACVIALQLECGLWSLAAHAVTRALVVGAWLNLAARLPHDPAAGAYTLEAWYRDVWSLQWRVGVSWLFGFVFCRSAAPLVMLARGPVDAGRFGLAIAIMNLLLAITLTWPLSQTARYAAALQSGRWHEVDREFPRLLAGSTALSAAAVVVLCVVLAEARELGLAFAQRLTEPPVTAIVLAAATVHHVAGCVAVVLRAEGREPMLVPSVVGAFVYVAAITLTARHGTLLHVALANAVLAATMIPVVLAIYARRRRARGMALGGAA